MPKTFEIVTGQQPLFPHTLDSLQSVRSPIARSFSEQWKQNVDIARSYLEKAKADEEVCRSKPPLHRVQYGRPCDGEGSGLEIIKVIKERDPRLMRKYVGHLPIIRRIGTVAYKIELPSCWKIQNIFHLTMLSKRRGRRHLRWGRMSRDACVLGTLDAHSAVQPLNLADHLHRQTLDFRSLRILGVGLLSCTYCKLLNRAFNLLLSYCPLVTVIAAVALCVAISVGTLC
ncbi:UNVERIFIED_CONTAM: hypothetical protein Sradi_4446600 [Sesamum radiatum]|uniref:Tf2-1-like SH3-like domain-containing protein n=1 Tax=Sesamum radiatum TaxID=300843 RepID=A0AAW2NRZ0_SESRA